MVRPREVDSLTGGRLAILAEAGLHMFNDACAFALCRKAIEILA